MRVYFGLDSSFACYFIFSLFVVEESAVKHLTFVLCGTRERRKQNPRKVENFLKISTSQ